MHNYTALLLSFHAYYLDSLAKMSVCLSWLAITCPSLSFYCINPKGSIASLLLTQFTTSPVIVWVNRCCNFRVVLFPIEPYSSIALFIWKNKNSTWPIFWSLRFSKTLPFLSTLTKLFHLHSKKNNPSILLQSTESFPKFLLPVSSSFPHKNVPSFHGGSWSVFIPKLSNGTWVLR